VTDLFDVIDALLDVLQLDLLFDAVGVGQDGVVLLLRLFHQVPGQGRQVCQVPQQLQHLCAQPSKSTIKSSCFNNDNNNIVHLYSAAFKEKLLAALYRK
jgi:hypothetical protein